MRYLFSFLVASLIFTNHAVANDYTLCLVRHAEKQTSSKDPSLTACGIKRANQLAEIFTNISLEAIYSTSYKRTMATAKPTAKQKSVGIKQYAANGLPQLARLLKERKQDALIVGHSNTTPQLLSLITGEDVVPMSEKEYQHLFQVHVSENKTNVVKLTQPLRCR